MNGNFLKWLKNNLTFIVTSFYAMGITPIILCSNGIIKVSELVLAAFWVTAVMSVIVITVTLTRWLKKYPSPLTWLQAGFGMVAVNTLIHSYVNLKTYYSEDGVPGSTIAILAAIVLALSAFATYLVLKAIKSGFAENKGG
jgi:hypothetical protein